MRPARTPAVARRFRKLTPAQQHAVEVAIRRLVANPADPRLRLHRLTGQLAGQLAFSAGYDLRVVCRIEGDVAYLLTVGSHDEVY